MEKFVLHENIIHYRDQLKTEADPVKKKMLQKLLAEAEEKQVELGARPNLDGLHKLRTFP